LLKHKLYSLESLTFKCRINFVSRLYEVLIALRQVQEQRLDLVQLSLHL